MPFSEYYPTIDTSIQPFHHETTKSLFERLTMSITVGSLPTARSSEAGGTSTPAIISVAGLDD
jgi:hypothetical protein